MIDVSFLAFLRAPWNALAYSLRTTIRWSRGAPPLRHEPKSDAELFDFLDARDRPLALAREKELSARYGIARDTPRSSIGLYREWLYLLDLLECASASVGPPPLRSPSPMRALDIGSKDWSYVVALERWLRRWGRQEASGVELVGVEIDGHGIYDDLYARCDYARAYAALTGNARVEYRVADFLAVDDGKFDVITVFYPFVLRFTLLAWGLPLRHFAPEQMLRHAAELLNPGGVLVVFNHTPEESDRLHAISASIAPLRRESSGPATSRLVDYYGDVSGRRFTVFRRTDTSNSGLARSAIES